MIDVVAGDTPSSEDNELAQLNVIANPVLALSGQTLDATDITPDTIRALHEAGGIEANVASGYHAIEFLLWGQDLNGTKPGAGKRPATDYNTAGCTNGHCDRRAQYLKAATDLLVSDLADMARRPETLHALRAAVACHDLLIFRKIWADSFDIRRSALTHGVPHYTTAAGARAAVHAIAALRAGTLDVAPLQAYFHRSF